MTTNSKVGLSFKAIWKDRELGIKTRGALALSCKADPVMIGIMDRANNIRLKPFQQHIEECQDCGLHTPEVTSVVLLSADEEDVMVWHEGLIRDMPSSEVLSFSRTCHYYKDAPLFNLLTILKNYKGLPFNFSEVPYLFLHRLFMKEVPNLYIAQLFQVRNELVIKRRNFYNIVNGRSANHVYELLKEAAVGMLREGESIENVSACTGIDTVRMRLLRRLGRNLAHIKVALRHKK